MDRSQKLHEMNMTNKNFEEHTDFHAFHGDIFLKIKIDFLKKFMNYLYQDNEKMKSLISKYIDEFLINREKIIKLSG